MMTAQVLSTPMNTLRGILGSRDRDILGLDDDDSLVSESKKCAGL